MTRKQRRRIERALAEGLPLTRARIDTPEPKVATTMKLAEVARALGVHRSTAKRLADQGRLPATRQGHGHWKVTPEALRRYAWTRARRAAG